MGRGQYPPIEVRFWAAVDRRGPDDCWLWTASRRAGGYGQITYLGAARKAHRISFWLANGYLPEAVMHTCDNPPCVNPAHLRGGTKLENWADMRAKGRGSKPPVRKRSTHCRRGHELTSENVYLSHRGDRQCRTCVLTRMRQSRAAA